MRGAGGGVRLTRSPENIRLLELVLTLDDEHLLTGCVLGLQGCGEAKPCPLHESWSVERTRIRKLFEETNLDKLSDKIADGSIRLTDCTKPPRPKRKPKT